MWTFPNLHVLEFRCFLSGDKPVAILTLLLYWQNVPYKPLDCKPILMLRGCKTNDTSGWQSRKIFTEEDGHVTNQCIRDNWRISNEYLWSGKNCHGKNQCEMSKDSTKNIFCLIQIIKIVDWNKILRLVGRWHGWNHICINTPDWSIIKIVIQDGPETTWGYGARIFLDVLSRAKKLLSERHGFGTEVEGSEHDCLLPCCSSRFGRNWFDVSEILLSGRWRA